MVCQEGFVAKLAGWGFEYCEFVQESIALAHSLYAAVSSAGFRQIIVLLQDDSGENQRTYSLYLWMKCSSKNFGSLIPSRNIRMYK